MDQIIPSISIPCLEHESQSIGVLDFSSDPKKLGYCCMCLVESQAKGSFPQKLKPIQDYVKETFDFYTKGRQRLSSMDEPPSEYQDELSKKGERFEKFSRHIDEEKQKVTRRFEDIRQKALELIALKEKECMRLLDEELSSLSDAYRQYERLLKLGWKKFSDQSEAVYPTDDVLQQRVSRIIDIDQLQVFVKEVTEDVQIEELYCNGQDGVERRKAKIHHLIEIFQKAESSLPHLGGQLLSSGDLDSLMKKLLKEFSLQKIGVENSVSLKIKLPCESQIINAQQYEVLKSWLPNSNNLSLKLLYRTSVDGKSPQIFHKKCDGKGATVTLIKCKFNGAVSSSVLGGFIDQSLHSNADNCFIVSNAAFLFSMTPGAAPLKCPIIESQQKSAFYGHPSHGIVFGEGNDIFVNPNFNAGTINPRSYSNAIHLRLNDQKKFVVEEVEVFHVQEKMNFDR